MAYKIVRFYKFNHHNSATEALGDVDIRPNYFDSVNEKIVAEESLGSYGIVDLDKIVRFITIIEAPTFNEAINESRIIFEDTLDLLMRYPMADIYNCEDAGYYCNFENFVLKPFIKPDKPSNSFGYMFHVNNGTYWHITPQQFIASGRDDELVKSYFRSINWYNKGKKQNRLYLRFLFSWISLETISKNNETDTIVPKLCLMLGFPLKNDCQRMDRLFLTDLTKKILNYRKWRNFIYDHFEQCRILRNSIVHSGFKETDVDHEDMRIKLYLINYVFQNIMSFIESEILSAETSLSSAWDKAPSMLYKNKSLIESINGNLIYMLENKKEIPFLFGD